MLAKRLVAALVAIGLVAGALWLRSRIDSSGDEDGPAGPSTTVATTATLVCVPEVAAACRAVPGAEVVVEPAGTTIDRLSRADDTAPVRWVTLAPLPALVDDLRGRAGLPPIFPSTVPLASSKLVLVGRTAQMGVLGQHCASTPAWKCVGEVAGAPWTDLGGELAWGTVKPAHESAATSARGLLTFANAVVSWFGRADLTTSDLDDQAFLDWVRRLERSIPSFGGPETTPFEQMLLVPEINVVGTTEAEVEAEAGARRGELALTYPAPMAQADAVVASSADGALPARSVEALSTALQGAKWGAPAPAPDGGLPPTPLLQALRQLWSEVTR
jgi:hypothetical protein